MNSETVWKVTPYDPIGPHSESSLNNGKWESLGVCEILGQVLLDVPDVMYNHRSTIVRTTTGELLSCVRHGGRLLMELTSGTAFSPDPSKAVEAIRTNRKITARDQIISPV